ncbi:MBL fold metallo-hydrolase [bacterium D16-54]|nr:MBL fold metallo-hydrolase [bacterium D16-54]RKJ16319.1 MBL fold metallo-hydrolase [bacterium D16-56]
MRQRGQRNWLGGMLVTGLFAASIMSVPGTDSNMVRDRSFLSDNGLEAAEDAGMYAAYLPVKKSSFFLTEYIASEVTQLRSPGQAESTENPNQMSPVSTQTSQGTGQMPSGTQQTAAPDPGTNTGGSRVITAGQDGTGSVGPSIYGNIITEGEKQVLPQDVILGGASLTLFNSRGDSQILSAILQTSQGSLIVIDGGLGEDGDFLRSQIQARGSHVAAWLITHPHGDHVGALYKILQDEAAGIRSGIQIDGIYYSFADPEWYTNNDSSEQTMAHAIIGSFSGLPEAMLNTVTRGQTIQVDDVTIQVMNDRYETGSDKGNNAGIVYKLWVNGKSILFLGDMAEEGGQRLLAENGSDGLKSDIVQMAHHGQNGVGEDVYRAINPEICLWPTPGWLWDNVGSKYRTAETKGWISRLNVQRHYCTKDGDQVIR